MAEQATIDDALAGLSVAIAGIMEDEVDAAVTSLPAEARKREARFATLIAAGEDIAALAAAAKVLLRRHR